MSNEREELADGLQQYALTEDRDGSKTWEEYADVILAAGYRKSRTVTRSPVHGGNRISDNETMISEGRKLHDAWFGGPDMEPRDRMIRMAKVAREIHQPEAAEDMTPLEVRRDALALDGWGVRHYDFAPQGVRVFIDRIIELEEATK